MPVNRPGYSFSAISRAYLHGLLVYYSSVVETGKGNIRGSITAILYRDGRMFIILSFNQCTTREREQLASHYPTTKRQILTKLYR